MTFFCRFDIFFVVLQSQPSQPSHAKPSEDQTKKDNGHSVNTNPESIKPLVVQEDDAAAEPAHQAGSCDASTEPHLQGGSHLSEVASVSSFGGSSVVVKYTVVESEHQPERVRKLSLGEQSNSTEGHEEIMQEEEEEESEDEKQDSLAAPRVILVDLLEMLVEELEGGGGG